MKSVVVGIAAVCPVNATLATIDVVTWANVDALPAFTNTPGQWDVFMNWTDDSAPAMCANNLPCALMYMTSNNPDGFRYGGLQQGVSNHAPNTVAVIQAKAGVPITYSVMADPNGSPTGSTYELFITVEQLM